MLQTADKYFTKYKKNQEKESIANYLTENN